jgi:pimeloyl-ACP methyl ester carboxylesterase
MSKDIRRSVDYLQTRNDIDMEKLAYAGLSMGALHGPTMVATEDRFKVAVLLKGGFCPCLRPAPVDPANYVSRVKIPVLMVSGLHDYVLPYEMGQLPFFRLIGTPDEEKEHIVYPGGHSLTWEVRKDYEKDVLNWLDRKLGPVHRELQN